MGIGGPSFVRRLMLFEECKKTTTAGGVWLNSNSLPSQACSTALSLYSCCRGVATLLRLAETLALNFRTVGSHAAPGATLFDGQSRKFSRRHTLCVDTYTL